jgi:hypothetical protein
MEEKVCLEVIETGQWIVLNVVFLDTGEIRQRKFTREAFFKRLFIYNDWVKDLRLEYISFPQLTKAQDELSRIRWPDTTGQ